MNDEGNHPTLSQGGEDTKNRTKNAFISLFVIVCYLGDWPVCVCVWLILFLCKCVREVQAHHHSCRKAVESATKCADKLGLQHNSYWKAACCVCGHIMQHYTASSCIPHSRICPDSEQLVSSYGSIQAKSAPLVCYLKQSRLTTSWGEEQPDAEGLNTWKENEMLCYATVIMKLQSSNTVKLTVNNTITGKNEFHVATSKFLNYISCS